MTFIQFKKEDSE